MGALPGPTSGTPARSRIDVSRFAIRTNLGTGDDVVLAIVFFLSLLHVFIVMTFTGHLTYEEG
jgi:hypothetical protein